MKERLIIYADFNLIERGEVIDIMNSSFKTFKLEYVKDGTNIGKGIFVLEGDSGNIFQLRKSLNIVKVKSKKDETKEVCPFVTNGIPLD